MLHNYFHNYIALKSFLTKSLLPVILECQIVVFELIMNNEVVIERGQLCSIINVCNNLITEQDTLRYFKIQYYNEILNAEIQNFDDAEIPQKC